MTKNTDWNQYYERPYKTASFSRAITAKKLVRLIRKFANNQLQAEQFSITELGGANSCFYQKMKKEFNPVTYLVVDNNQTGLVKLQERVGNDGSLITKRMDILEDPKAETEVSSVVYSVGLIEHFDVQGTAKAIESHFRFLAPEGICIIAFPTATLLYRISRKLAEMFKFWIFWDERPLDFSEVIGQVTKHGTMLNHSITWSIFFTQGVIVAKKRKVE